MIRKSSCKLYGYEDYEMFDINMYGLVNSGTASPNRYYYTNYRDILCISKALIDINGYFDVKELEIEENPSALDSAKKIYIHPSCTISRDMVRRKFNTCLNVAVADALVVPTPKNNNVNINSAKAIFINEDLKTIYTIDFSWCKDNSASADYNEYVKCERKMYNELCNTPVGKVFSDLQYLLVHTYEPSVEGLRDAEFLSIGPIAEFADNDRYLFDFATLTLPKNKVVFQETLLASLADETNTPTADTLYNLYEMMLSEDRSVRELGMKTLATLDYAHYPVSTMAVLDNTDWRLNNSWNTTAVKFMLSTLGIRTGSRRRRMPYPDHISKEDWEVYKELMHRIKKFDSNTSWISFCLNFSFVAFDPLMNPHPRTFQ